MKIYITKGRSGDFGFSAKELREAMKDTFGGVQQAIETMSNNANLITKEVPSWAPDRQDMPVIEPNEVPQAAELLNKGKVDWAEPFRK